MARRSPQPEPKKIKLTPKQVAGLCALFVLLVLLVWFIFTRTALFKREDPNSYANKMKKVEGAAAALQEMGAKLTEKQYPPYGNGWIVNLSGKPISDDLFDRLKALGHVTELDLSKTNVTDAQMARLNEMEVGSTILNLDLSNTGVTDAGLEKLTNLFFLTNLNLTGSQVTPAGVARFKKNRANDPKFMKQFKSPTVRL